jgi:uncharacterized BrkB/YihY/UPF0761 family membrane protein
VKNVGTFIKRESQLLSRKLCLRHLAGLLTYSLILAAFPKLLIISGIVASVKELTAAGTVRDFHPIPY